MKIRHIASFIILVVLAGCKPEIKEFSPSKGNADFTKFVAVGNSLTAGYADGEVYKTGQSYSFANILAQQFKTVGGGEFRIPYMLDELGFGSKLVLGSSTDCMGVTSVSPIPAPGTPNILNFTSISAQGPYNNLGVPGAKSYHILAPNYGDISLGLGNFNPYFARFASSAAASMIGDAVSQNPTFFSLWIGNNDVLLYATKGGDYGGDQITPVSTFTASIDGAVNALLATGAKGAIANIPDVIDIPYFTTVPINGLVLDDAHAAQLNAAYATYNTGAQAMDLPPITFHAGPNAWVIQDTTGVYAQLGMRQIRPGEFILLSVPQDSLKPCPLSGHKPWGSQVPIPSIYVLDAKEVSNVMSATANFNGYIASVVDEVNSNGVKLTLVDINTLFKGFVSGMVFDGIQLNTRFVQGGLFSLDGVHPNPRGQAVIANYFIESINAKFNADIPKVNISDYPGIIFP